MYACKCGLSNQIMRVTIMRVSECFTLWPKVISREINHTETVAGAG